MGFIAVRPHGVGIHRFLEHRDLIRPFGLADSDVLGSAHRQMPLFDK
jgi:hypothetical protein